MSRTPIRQLRSTPVLETTRPAPQSSDGSSWPGELEVEYADLNEHLWEYWECVECDSCGKITTAKGFCETEGCDAYGEYNDSREGPMMNYWYPLGGSWGFDPEEAARKLADTCVCVVEVGGDYGLALTGGGMDLTWEIVDAFTRLGYLPPIEHTRLPNFAGKKYDTKAKYLIGACREANRSAIRSARYNLVDLARLTKRFKEDTDA